MTIPIFKSHYSIGKSILTLSPASEKDPEEGLQDGSISVFDIAKENNLKQVVIVEDSLTGFLEADKVARELGVQLIFGVRFDVCNDASNEESIKESNCKHKIIIFPKNSQGCRSLNKIYTECKTNHNNLTSFDSCVVNFKFTKPTFFMEDNGLPFDFIVKEKVIQYCDVNKFEIEDVQSIYYKNKDDFSAYLTYKLICGRNSFAGRQLSLEKPNFDHLGSDQFCWESYMEKLEQTS